MSKPEESPPIVWVGFLVVGLMSLIEGLILAIAGADAVPATIRDQLGISWQDLLNVNPGFAQYVNTLIVIIGLLITGYSLFVIAVSVTGYRRRHKWAWYAMWNPVLYFAVLVAILFSKGDIFTNDVLSPEFLIVELIIAIAFQLIGYSSFFRTQIETQRQGTM